MRGRRGGAKGPSPQRARGRPTKTVVRPEPGSGLPWLRVENMVLGRALGGG